MSCRNKRQNKRILESIATDIVSQIESHKLNPEIIHFFGGNYRNMRYIGRKTKRKFECHRQEYKGKGYRIDLRYFFKIYEN